MANYTFELRQIVATNNIFENMPFYTDDETAKKEFQDKFIMEYYFHEIGQETYPRWQWQLNAKLRLIMPYYKQLYATELKAQNIEFLLNKDYTETLERTVARDAQTNGSAEGTNTSKVSDIANGVADVGLAQGYLTGMSETTGSNTNEQTATDNEDESYTLVGKGNIGTTSSAELLEKWRQVLINIDQLIIDECRELFMTIY